MTLRDSIAHGLQNVVNKLENKPEHDRHGSVPTPQSHTDAPHSASPHQSPFSPHHERKPYWQPNYNHVTDSFEHELGSDGWGNHEVEDYVNSSDNSWTQNGQIHVRGVVDGNRYTSARLSSKQKLSKNRGVLSARINAPLAVGIWPAFWLLPTQPFDWPRDGEIDIFEAWNASADNHTCFHWGHHDAANWERHRVVVTPLDVHKLWVDANATSMGEGIVVEFAWIDEDNHPDQARMVWYIDGRPVMKTTKPAGTRRMRDWRVLINMAMGGDVCQGRVPAPGNYQMVVRDLAMFDEPVGGWSTFDRDFENTAGGFPNRP